MTDESRRRSGIFIRLGIKLAVALGLLALAVWSNRSQLHRVFDRHVQIWPFVVAFGCYMGGMLLAYGRWYLLVRAVGLPFRLADAVRLGMIGTLFNFVIPGAIGGDFVRAAYLCREQSRRTEPIASVLLDRLTGLLGLFLLACIAGTSAWTELGSRPRRLVTAAWIATGATSLILAAAFLPSLRRGTEHDSERPKRFSRLRTDLGAVGRAYRSHFWVVILGVVGGLLTHTLNVLAFHLVGQAMFPVLPTLAQDFLIVPLVLFSTAVPLPFGGLGVSEHVSGQLFRLASANTGAVTMMGFRILQLGAALIGGAVYLLNQSQVRALTKTAAHLEDELDEEAALADEPDVDLGVGAPSDR